MANAVYPIALTSMMSGSINLTSDTIKVALVDSGYTYSAAHEFMSSVAAGRVGIAGDDQTLGTKTVGVLGEGVFDAADSTRTSLPGGDTVTGLVIYKFITDDASSPVLAYIDTDSGGAINFVTNGSDLTVTWNASGILQIS